MSTELSDKKMIGSSEKPMPMSRDRNQNSSKLNQLPPTAFQNLSTSFAVTPVHAPMVYRVFDSHSYSYLTVCMQYIYTCERESLSYPQLPE